MNCPYEDSHKFCTGGNACVCGHREDAAKPVCWKASFATGERFQIKSVSFEVAAISKRGLVLRKVSA